MQKLRHLATRLCLALALAFVTAPGLRAGDSPAPLPKDPERAVNLARALAIEAEATTLWRKGEFARATPLARESLALRETTLGRDHPDVAASLNLLAVILKAQAAYEEARRLYERALAIDEGAPTKDERNISSDLNNLGLLLLDQGAYAEARPLLERALEIRERVLGSDDPDVATSLNSLASALKLQGAWEAARPLYERALAIREKALGREHRGVATALNNLAWLLQDLGAYAEARPLLDRALEIREKALGKDHPEVATVLGNLAGLLAQQGSYAEARPLYERALAIDEKALGKDHPRVAASLNNLGMLLLDLQAYAEAEPLLERALAIKEKTLAGDPRSLATALSNLALVRKARGSYAEARSLYERALAIDEKALGGDHPDVAAILTHFAQLLGAQGAYAEARPLLDRALSIREHAFGKDHPEVAASLTALASLLQAQSAYAEARPLLERGLEITARWVRAQLSALSARQRLALLRSTRSRLDAWLELAPHVGLSGYPEVLRFRGMVGRAEAAERLLARHASKEERGLEAALRTAQRLASRLANDVPPASSTAARKDWQRRYAEVTAERERLTLELSQRSAPLRGALERLDLGVLDVQARLAEGEALVDFLRVRDRYLAFVVGRKGEVVRVDLGEAKPIELAAVSFVEASRRSDVVTSASSRGRTPEATAGSSGTEAWLLAGGALRALVIDPIEKRLPPGVRTLCLVPDAALAAVPFAALPGRAAGRVLLDDYVLRLFATAQDLVPRAQAQPPGTGALLVGGVDYAHADATPGAVPTGSPVPAGVDRAPRGGEFTPLPQTRFEAEGLATRLGQGGATLLLGSEATEARFRDGVRGKGLVHVATHGFAREDLFQSLDGGEAGREWTSAAVERQLSVGHDPMLLCGLALAGAGPREGGGRDDGILTALEASALDLEGVELVTLSACETARGTSESGEGVLGLVSAFQMAGARSVMASLWLVDDEATRQLMDGVYERLLRKERPLPISEALREASLALRDSVDARGKARFASPKYWAAFVVYGE